ncbi:hypothetical protein [Paractinoplanes brasiliensis]|uniref:Colicin immunity protein/pyocin immunity protein n=1 Tax=Paractinoplanes brasiliensis TaxID=52695 RepID=A0A4R6K4T7_9ACTN|nr:hypothetical protein [Actinoplanes brasiliensis]TDO42235.1 hypothetical protein C8E87_6002 [Actinoplanes brasiliensis]GID29464.1 hypothetical protein Abr02nite_44470 [Actinoplanes brasiliensis]
MIESELRARCLELVHMIRSGAGSEEEGDRYFEELQRIKPNPNWADIMFYRFPDLSDEEVVEEGLAYRPMAL